MIEGLRPVEDKDVDALVEMIGAIYANYPGCRLLVEDEEPDLLTPTQTFKGGGGWWVVVRDGRLIASVAHSPSSERPGWAKLRKLYVAAQARGAGLGAALARLAQEDARAKGVRQMHLWSDCRFLEAHRLYRRLGWQQSPLTRMLDDESRTSELEFLRQL